jgi:hypothetical protein
LADVPRVLKRIKELSRELATVVSVGVSTRCDIAGEECLGEMLEGEGYAAYRGKTNLGLGRMTSQ